MAWKYEILKVVLKYYSKSQGCMKSPRKCVAREEKVAKDTAMNSLICHGQVKGEL